ncbi:hypothetical protein RUM43_000482 [Polyplax serrata]|uniref:Uncharacterized protein n=1 Tax=Polyplax serrata TaxID=468196 RepID=A0AAN8XP36_POLSC
MELNVYNGVPWRAMEGYGGLRWATESRTDSTRCYQELMHGHIGSNRLAELRSSFGEPQIGRHVDYCRCVWVMAVCPSLSLSLEYPNRNWHASFMFSFQDRTVNEYQFHASVSVEHATFVSLVSGMVLLGVGGSSRSVKSLRVENLSASTGSNLI